MAIKKYISVNLSLTPAQLKNIVDLQKLIYENLGCKLSKKEVYLFGIRTLAKKFGISWSDF